MPWEVDRQELRLFESVDFWARQIVGSGFADTGKRLLQDHDPSLIPWRALSSAEQNHHGNDLSIAFEAQCPTGLRGIPPNLDLVLELEDGHVVAIESKYSEWLQKYSQGYAPFRSKYFRGKTGLWAERGFPRAQVLAELVDENMRFRRYRESRSGLSFLQSGSTSPGKPARLK